MGDRWNPTARPQVIPPGGPQGNAGGLPTSAAGARGWAGKNRTTLLAAGAAGVVMLALVMKSRSGASADGSTAAGTMTTNPQNMAAYDSTSSDVYNAIQPQLEALQDLWEEWKVTKDAASTVPVSTTPSTTPTTTTPVTTTPTTTPVFTANPTGAYTAEQVTNIFKSPVGTALAQQGILPPSDSGATNSQQQADYGKSYESMWNEKYGLK